MFSADNFYNYLHHYLIHKDVNTQLYAFEEHGSRDLKDLKRFGPPDELPVRYPGKVALFDQEPIELDYFLEWINFDPKDFKGTKFTKYHKHFTPTKFVFNIFAAVHTPILCHSEKNSGEVKLFTDNHFSEVYYFYHGLLAREWFRHWKHYNMHSDESAKRFGLYARSAEGTRAYRLDLLEKLVPYKDNVFYRHQPEIADKLDPDIKRNWFFHNVYKGPECSAMIEVEDCKAFRIQLVAETLFNTTKTHLTEKVFKPMVMRQPFIVVGPPGSLQMLRDYGFRTFDGLWDESYDKEQDPDRRMEMVIDIVKHISNLNEAAFDRIMDRAQSAIQHNHTRFFSHAFEDDMMSEMYFNFDIALKHRADRFNSMPGGTWFLYQDMLLKEGHKPPVRNKKINQAIIDYMGTDDAVAKQILSKYKDLF